MKKEVKRRAWPSASRSTGGGRGARRSAATAWDPSPATAWVLSAATAWDASAGSAYLNSSDLWSNVMYI